MDRRADRTTPEANHRGLLGRARVPTGARCERTVARRRAPAVQSPPSLIRWRRSSADTKLRPEASPMVLSPTAARRRGVDCRRAERRVAGPHRWRGGLRMPEVSTPPCDATDATLHPAPSPDRAPHPCAVTAGTICYGRCHASRRRRVLDQRHPTALRTYHVPNTTSNRHAADLGSSGIPPEALLDWPSASSSR